MTAGWLPAGTTGGRSAQAAPRPGQLFYGNKESGSLALPATHPDKRKQNRTAASASARTHGLRAPVCPWPPRAATRRTHCPPARVRRPLRRAASSATYIQRRGCPAPARSLAGGDAPGKPAPRLREVSAPPPPELRPLDPQPRCRPEVLHCAGWSAPFQGPGLNVPGSASVLAGLTRRVDSQLQDHKPNPLISQVEAQAQ